MKFNCYLKIKSAMQLKKSLLTFFLSLYLFNCFSLSSVKITMEGLTETPTTVFIKKELIFFFTSALKQSIFSSQSFEIVLRKDKFSSNGTFMYETDGKGKIVLSGEDPACISHAAYSFLEALGYRFEISGVSIPVSFSFAVLKGKKEKITPFTRWRGIRQHVNFPMDISSYPIEEAKEYLRNLLRLRFNKIAVHSYPGLWHEVKTKDTTILGGDFFYGRLHEIPDLPIFKKNIRFNQKIFCIPPIEPFYQSRPERSEKAVAWMKSLLLYAKEIGLQVQFSVEPRSSGNMQLIMETCKSVADQYPMIDELEIITEELGGWGAQCTEAKTKAVLVEQFGAEILKDTIVTGAIKPVQTDLDNLYFQMGRNIKAVKNLQQDSSFKKRGIRCKIGIYCAIPAYARAAYQLARIFLTDTEVSIMPGHGSKRVAENFPVITNKKEDIKKTTIYSWIEFDGLMFTQQNAIEGIHDLMQYLKGIVGTTQNQSVLFNHWRTAESRTSARYASQSSLFGPIEKSAFYSDYAQSLGITNKTAFTKAMDLLEKIDWISTNDLPNVGFCWVGAWRQGGSYEWMNRLNLQKVNELYSRVDGLLTPLLKNKLSPSAKKYLSFLENRVSASRLYLSAFSKATEIQTLQKDSSGNISILEQKRAGEICNQALLIFNQYLSLHAEMLPDRGSEGTLINMWHAPIYGLKFIRNKLAHIPMESEPVSEQSSDEPPLPIFYEKK